MSGDPSSSKSPSSSRRQAMGKGKAKGGPGDDSPHSSSHQLDSVRPATRLPTSLQQSAPLLGARPPKSLSSIPDKKLRANLSREVLSQRRAQHHAAQADTFLHQGPVGQDAGLIETESELERTARLTQREIRDAVGVEAATKSFSLDLSGGRGGVGLGPYRSSYTPNGRQLLLAGRSGHLATFDWQSGRLGCEIQVKETVRDATWLHNASFFAAAQKRHVYIYDHTGAEVHQLTDHVDVNRLTFLRYHFLLASVGNAGWLKYQDTSTGQLVAQHRTKLGPCATLAQNPLTAVVHLGHSNGTVTLWTPNLSTPALTLLAHRGPVSGISINPRDGGREMATAGLDGALKLWDCRMLGRGCVREWASRKPANEVQFSQRGLLAAAWGSHVSLYDPRAATSSASTSSASAAPPPGPYLTHNLPKSSPLSLQFCPFEDVLGVAHARGFDSLLVPGSGEPRFDSAELDPYEGKTARREREVRALLDKIQPDMISVDPSFLGRFDAPSGGAKPREAGAGDDADAEQHAGGIRKAADGTPYARLSRVDRLRLDGLADEGEGRAFTGAGGGDSDDEGAGGAVVVSQGPPAPAPAPASQHKEKHRARGRNTAMKRYLRKKRANVVDANSLAAEAKVRKAREAHQARVEGRAGGKGGEGEGRGDEGALGVFKAGAGRQHARRRGRAG